MGNLQGHRKQRREWPWLLLLLICLGGWNIPVWGQSHPTDLPNPRLTQVKTDTFPALQSHPLPSSLATWPETAAGDYFDQVQPLEIGYLLWSHFPVRVYLQPLTTAEQANDFLRQQAQTWINAVKQAVQEWNRYLPLQLVDTAETANITIWRRSAPLKLERDPNGRLRLGRARSAEARFELLNIQRATAIYLEHRFFIWLRPDQAPLYLLAAARHELGHALGIWGHSPLESDALYFSQVRYPPTISERDVNTLKRVYLQPTRLGWPLARQ